MATISNLSQRRSRLLMMLRVRRSVWRWLYIGAVLLGILAAITLWVVTRSWFLVVQLRPELEKRFGGEVAIMHAKWEGSSRLVLRGLTVRSRELSGDAAELIHIGRAEAVLRPASLVSGRVQVLGIELDDVRVRLSENAAGVFNIMSLSPTWEPPDDEEYMTGLPPYIKIHKALVEVGHHDGTDYKVFGRRWVEGEMVPVWLRKGMFAFELTEWGKDIDDGLEIRGQWNVATNEYRSVIDGLALDESTYRMCPNMVRFWWDKMNLGGQVSRATIGWDAGEALFVEFDVEDVGLTLPAEINALWSRYRNGRIENTDDRPRMHVTSGNIRLEHDRLLLNELVGEVRGSTEGDNVLGVPYRVSLSLEDLPPLSFASGEEWFERAIQSAPFTMKVNLDQFHMPEARPERAPAVDLPQGVAKLLEKFAITDWRLTSEFEIRRDGTEGARIETEGFAYIQDASGAFQNFPYALDDIEAYVEFDHERATIHRLEGHGSNEVPIHLEGEISPLGRDAQVELRLTARGVPLDDRLRTALNDNQRKVFDVLLPSRTSRSLREAGLLPDAASVAATVTRRDRRQSQLDRVEREGATDDESASLRREIAQLDRLIDAGPFDLGGAVDLNLLIRRPKGFEQRTTITGQIDMESVGLLYANFPYPIQVVEGRLDWTPDGIEIMGRDGEAGASIITSGGGGGEISGVIGMRLMQDGSRVMESDLVVEVEDDQINPMLFAAIPMAPADRAKLDDPNDWPGEAESATSGLLRGLGLDGPLDYRGTIRNDAGDPMRFAFDLKLKDGTAAPTRRLSEKLNLPGFSGPLWRFYGVEGRIHVDNDRVEIVTMAGQHDAGGVTASGSVDLGDSVETAMDVRFDDITVEPFLIDLVPPDNIDKARNLWDLYRPGGSFDALLSYRSNRESGAPLMLRVWPDSISIEFDGRPITVRLAEGFLDFTSDEVHFRDLVIDLHDATRPDGRMNLRGGYRLRDDGAIRGAIDGDWTDGQFRCPIIPHLLGQLSDPMWLTHFRDVDPQGVFSGEFAYSVTDDGPDFAVDLQPETLVLNFEGRPVTAHFSPDSRIAMTPERVELIDFGGHITGGDFSIGGAIQGGPTLVADLDVAYEGRLRAPSLMAMVPASVRDSLDSLDFNDGAGTALRNARLWLSKTPESEASEDHAAGWRILFQGDVVTSGAAMNAGILLTDLDGVFSIAAKGAPDEPPTLAISVRDLSFSAFDHALVDGAAAVNLVPEEDAIEITELRGRLHEGLVTAQASLGIEDNRRYDARVELVGVQLAPFLEKKSDEVPAEDADTTLARLSTVPEGRPEPYPEEVATSAGQTRAEIFGGIHITGVRGRPDLRSGRGIVRILGQVANVPVLLQISQIGHLTWPAVSSLEFVDVDFFVAGNEVMFERILFESVLDGDMPFGWFEETAPLQLYGKGSMEIPSLELDTHFRSRGGWPGFRDVVGAIGDQIYVIEVTGPLGKPEARVVPLPGITSPDALETTPRAETVLGER